MDHANAGISFSDCFNIMSQNHKMLVKVERLVVIGVLSSLGLCLIFLFFFAEIDSYYLA